MKVRITITGYLEMEFEHDVQQTGTYYIDNQCMPFVKQCIEATVDAARKLAAPQANDQRPATNDPA